MQLLDLPLGVSYSMPGGDAAVVARQPVVRLWAPTARSVTLHLFADGGSDTPASHVMPMKRDARSGTWSLQGTPEWDRMYYQYEVDVFVPATGQFETSMVTDPYSLNLSMYSTRSHIVDLADDSLKPDGWEQHGGPTLEAPEDIALYELHVREEWRCKGVGRKLLDMVAHLETPQTTRSKRTAIELNVHTANLSARTYYGAHELGQLGVLVEEAVA